MIIMNKCKKCGYKWDSKLDKPISCPKCKSYSWDEDYKDKRIIREVKNGSQF